METNSFLVRLGAWSGALAALILAAMIAVGAGASPDLAKLQSLAPATVAQALPGIAATAQTLMVLDDLFVVAYITMFIGLAAYVRERAGWLAIIALVFALLTGFFDFVENSVTLALVAFAQARNPIEPGQLFAMTILSQVKYLCTNVALALFGAGLWNMDASRDRVMSVLLFLFVPLNVLAFVIAPLATVRVFGMLVLLTMGAVILARQR
ncbi:MAG: hypothetical protein HY868_01425 [Chloroflexi bacterium]|nr:hypothetical protein [Chloroflexota bacterium]